MELILRDFFSFAPTAGRRGGSSIDPAVREAARTGKGLKVTFVASHAGTVNGNNVMYSPKGIKDCLHTWVWPQRKPIQVHHDDQSDPIGRVINSLYSGYGEADVSEGHRDALTIFDNLVKDNVIEAAKALEETQVLSQQNWKGVGELVLDGVITDSDAVEKFLDGRYQGVSVTQRPEQAFCNICSQDWVKDGPCEHNRGEKDEDSGRKMYLIVGNTGYVEISPVNSPADPYAMVLEAQPIEANTNNLIQQDEIDSESILLDKSMKTSVSFQLVDSLNEEVGMKDKTKDSKETKDTNPKQQDSIDPKPGSSDEGNQGDTSDENLDSEVTIEEALKFLFEDEENLTDRMCDVLFEAMEELVEEDAKLSTETRKKLAPSTFCGPNKSFPVPDCAHVTAARRLIGRYKGPGKKESILTCVSKRAKILGCGDKSKDSDQVEQDSFVLSDLSDEDLSRMLLDTEKLMVERGLRAERKCDKCEELTDKVSNLESSVPELESTVDVLRSEYRTILGEHTASEDAHSLTLKEFQDSLRDIVLTTLLLTDKDTSEEDLKVKIESMSFEDLKKERKDTNLSEIISFVRSGLSRDPKGTISVEDAKPESILSENKFLKLSESLINWKKGHGQAFALTVMSDWIKAGKLPEDFTLDKAYTLVAK